VSLCPILPLIWDKTGLLSCRAHLNVEICAGMDVSGGSATHHPACNEHTFPEKPENVKKPPLLLHLCPCKSSQQTSQPIRRDGGNLPMSQQVAEPLGVRQSLKAVRMPAARHEAVRIQARDQTGRPAGGRLPPGLCQQAAPGIRRSPASLPSQQPFCFNISIYLVANS